MPRKLEDILVDELSICEAAANKKKFFIQKQEKKMEELIEILKSFMGEDELEEEDIAKAKEMPDAAMKAIKGALNILNKYKDDFPSDILTAIKTLTKYASYGYPAKKEALSDEEVIEALEKINVEKLETKLSKATKDRIMKIIDQLKEILEIGEKKLKKEIDDFDKLPDDIKTKLIEHQQLKKAEAERIQKEKEDKEKARDEKIEKMEKELEALKKEKVEKLGLEGDEDPEKDKKKLEKKEDQFKSLKLVD